MSYSPEPAIDADSTRGPAQAPRRSSESLARERLRARLTEHPLRGISRGEVDFYFQSMPRRYWDRVTKTELMWGIETVHAFQARLGTSGSRSPIVVADARPYPERGLTKVMLCCYDRAGLLAKMAACFSALRVNILRADVYTRADGLALDLFDISELDDRKVFDGERLQQLAFLLEGALSDPPRFVSLWASLYHKSLPIVTERKLWVDFDNAHSDSETVIRVQTLDRPGLLHDLLEALCQCEVNIAEARVETEDHLARDIFYVTDLRGRKITASERLERIRKALIRAVSN
jgi:[protein-PII] uridylyltransferase